MQRLNVKLLLIVAITFVVLATGVVVVHGIQMSRNADSLIKRAEVAKEGEDLQEATRLYARYLTYRPNDIEQHGNYAMLAAEVCEKEGYSNARNYQSAVNALEHVVRQDKSRPEIRKKLVELQILGGQFALAKEHILELKASGEADSRDDVDLARCLVQTGDFNEALTVLQDLVGYDLLTKKFDASKAKAPDEIDAYLMYVLLLRERVSDVAMPDRLDVADRTIEQMVAANKDSAKAYLWQAQYLETTGKRDQVKPAIQRALELAPEDADTLLRAIDTAISEKDYPRAQELADKAVKLHPKDERVRQKLVVLAALQNKLPEAQKLVEEGLAALPTSRVLLEMQFNTQLQERDYKAARVTMEKLEAARFHPVALQLLRSRLLMGEGKVLEASRELEQLGSTQGIGSQQFMKQVDQLLLDCYGALNKPDLQLMVARRLMVTDPTMLQARLAAANALAAMGRIDESLTEYEIVAEALKQQNRVSTLPQVWMQMLRLRMAEQARQPKEKRDWAEVDALAKSIRDQELIPEPAISVLDADLLVRKGEIDRARQMLRELRQASPNDPIVINAQVNLELQARNADEAERLLNTVPADLRSRMNAFPARVETAVARGGNTAEISERLANLAKEAENLSELDRLRAYAALASAYANVGDRKTAQDYLRKLLEMRPNLARVRWTYFDISRETGDLNGLQESSRWFEKEYGRGSAEAKLAKAAELTVKVREAQRVKVSGSPDGVVLDDVDRENLNAARNLLHEVDASRPDWDEQPKLMAEINSMEGRFDDAIENLQEAVRLGSANAIVIKQLVNLLYLRHRMEDAQEVLDTYGTFGGGGFERVEAVINLSTGRSEEALQKIEAAVPRDSTNPQDHIFYGQLLAQIGRRAEAETEFRRAVELAPENGNAWLLLVTHLVGSGKSGEAHSVIQEAQLTLPEDRRAVVLAQGYESLGDLTLAELNYQDVLKAAPNDLSIQRLIASYYLRTKRPDKAKPHLNVILKQAPGQPLEKENLAWAKRTTARLLAGDGNYKNFKKAIELLTPAEGERLSPDNLSTRIGLLIARKDRPSAQQAVRLIEELKQFRPLTVEERVNLARMHEVVGDWSKARDEMLALLSQPQPHPGAYAAYIEMLLRRGSVDEAGRWLRDLERAAPNAPAMAGIKARVMAKQGRGQEAATELLRHVPTQAPIAADQLPRVLALARAMEQIEQYDKAEQLFRIYVASQPKAVDELGEFFARRGRVDDVLAFAEQHKKSLPSAKSLELLNVAIQKMGKRPSDEQYSRVQRLFDDAVREEPDNTMIRIQLGQLYGSQGRYEEAEKLYREAYQHVGPDQVRDRAVVANNLAFCLAVQEKDLDEGLKFAQEGIDYFGPVSSVLDTRGVVYLARKEVDKALADLNEAVADPDAEGIKFVHLAMAQAAANDPSAARRSLERAKDAGFRPTELPALEKKKFDLLIAELYKPA